MDAPLPVSRVRFEVRKEPKFGRACEHSPCPLFTPDRCVCGHYYCKNHVNSRLPDRCWLCPPY